METARAYIQLAFGIEQHFPGYVDAYFGPQAWKEVTKRPLGELAQEATDLLQQTQSLPFERRDWLATQVRSMQTVIAVLAGEPIGYRDEVRGTYDIDPVYVPEARFEEAKAVLEDLLPGSGHLDERLNAFRSRFVVPADKVKDLLTFVLERLAIPVRQRYALPSEESFGIELVNGRPWGAYNWYLGNYRSRIDLNTDLPTYLHKIPDTMAHEGYPGHHTERVLKEQYLSQYLESKIMLLNSPEAVISEGIAVKALEQIWSEAECQALLLELAQRVGLNIGESEVSMMREIDHQGGQLRYVSGNAALLLHQEKKSKTEVLNYVQHYALSTRERAQKTLEFITHPSTRSYIFTYTVGGDLLEALFAKGNAVAWFGRLLKEAITPGRVRAWTGDA